MQIDENDYVRFENAKLEDIIFLFEGVCFSIIKRRLNEPDPRDRKSLLYFNISLYNVISTLSQFENNFYLFSYKLFCFNRYRNEIYWFELQRSCDVGRRRIDDNQRSFRSENKILGHQSGI